MFHLAGYTMLIGPGSDIDVPAMSDDILTIQNNHFILAQQMGLMASLSYSPLLDRIKIATPSLRQLATPYIRPVSQGLAGVTNYNAALWNDHPLVLNPYEEIQTLATSTIASLTERFLHLIWLQSGYSPVPPGGWTALRFTSATAATANQWTTIPLTFADSIPSGVYSMLLSEVVSTNANAHRWIISNQYPRPGYPSFVNSISRHPYAVAKGQFGEMGRFRSNDLPRLQVLCNAADAVHTGYLHVTRVGSL